MHQENKKNLLVQFLTFILYSHVWIALGAVALYVRSNYLLQLPTPSKYELLFIGSAVIVAYNFLVYPVRFSTKKIQSPRLIALRILTILSIVLLFALREMNGNNFLILLVGLPLFFYKSPWGNKRLGLNWRRIPYIKPLIIAAMWIFATTLLPVIIFKSKDIIHLNTVIMTIGNFFFIASLCLVFDRKDKDWDQADGIKTLPMLLGQTITTTTILFGIGLAFVAQLSLLYLFTIVSWWNIAITSISFIVVAVVVTKVNEDHSRLFHQFVVDGLLIFLGMFSLLIQV